jgi:hypothetical protein
MPTQRPRTASILSVLGRCLLCSGALLLASPTLGAAGFAGVSLDLASQTVPPGGLLQMQVFITEPKPILKGGQKASFSARAALVSPLTTVRDGALFSPAGDVDGVAVLGPGTIQVTFNSPLTSFGTDLDTPVMAFALPVSAASTNGQKVPLTLDPASAQWFDPSGQQYPVELKSGTLTVGGKTSVTDVVPGAGLIPAGTIISIKGLGFQPTSKVSVNNAVVATTKFIGSTEIQITLTQSFDIEGERVRVDTGSERVEYYPYQRTTQAGKSTHPLVAASFPLFAHTTWTQAFFHPVLQGTTFSGIALQNLNASVATVTLQLFSSVGGLLATRTISLPTNTRMVRDYAEVFPGQVAGNGTTVKVTSNVAVELLGLLGDDALSTVSPVEPALQ